MLAAVGITRHHLTDHGYWDGLASVVIGLLLAVLAHALAQQNERALMGEALSPEVQQSLRRTVAESPGIDAVVELMTMRLGPGEVIVAARVDLDDDATAAQLEQAADEVERRIRAAHPEVRHVFLDPTDLPEGEQPVASP